MSLMTLESLDYDSCANEECPNRRGEGKFVRVKFNVSVGGHRGITLMMCAPCGEALNGKMRDF